MRPEQELALEHIKRNLNLTQGMKGAEIAEKLKERNIPLEEAPQYVEAAIELSDPEFRKATYATLEFKEKTGKTPMEAGAYLEELSSRIEGKKKGKSEWEEKAEKAKEGAKGWEEKRKEEKAKFEKEQALNRAALERSKQELKEEAKEGEKKRKEERGEFAKEQSLHRTTLERNKQEFNEELRRQDVVREKVEEFIDHKAQLQSIGLDLQTFDSILGEVVQKEGIRPGVGKKAGEKIKQVGSPDKAIAEMEKDRLAKVREISHLSKVKSEMNASLEKLNGLKKQGEQIIAEQGQVIKRQKEEIKAKEDYIKALGEQYELFESLMAMLEFSPSSSPDIGSLSSLGEKLQKIGKQGWIYSKETSPKMQRAIFVSLVMDSYLSSIRCCECGTAFLVNGPKGSYRLFYHCPVCGLSRGTKADDSFLRLMTSPDLSKLILNAKSILKAGEQSAPD